MATSSPQPTKEDRIAELCGNIEGLAKVMRFPPDSYLSLLSPEVYEAHVLPFLRTTLVSCQQLVSRWHMRDRVRNWCFSPANRQPGPLKLGGRAALDICRTRKKNGDVAMQLYSLVSDGHVCYSIKGKGEERQKNAEICVYQPPAMQPLRILPLPQAKMVLSMCAVGTHIALVDEACRIFNLPPPYVELRQICELPWQPHFLEGRNSKRFGDLLLAAEYGSLRLYFLDQKSEDNTFSMDLVVGNDGYVNSVELCDALLLVCYNRRLYVFDLAENNSRAITRVELWTATIPPSDIERSTTAQTSDGRIAILTARNTSAESGYTLHLVLRLLSRTAALLGEIAIEVPARSGWDAYVRCWCLDGDYLLLGDSLGVITWISISNRQQMHVQPLPSAQPPFEMHLIDGGVLVTTHDRVELFDLRPPP